MQGRLLCSVVALSLFALSSSMDPGRAGVYDSPSAQNYWIKRFGFMFGGGRSGVKGMNALQESVARRSRGHHALLWGETCIWGRAFRRAFGEDADVDAAFSAFDAAFHAAFFAHEPTPLSTPNRRRFIHQGGSFYKTDLAPLEASPKAIRLLKEEYMDKDPERITSLSFKPRLSALRSSSSASRLLTQETNMIKLEPFMVKMKNRSPKRFERFMAVP